MFVILYLLFFIFGVIFGGSGVWIMLYHKKTMQDVQIVGMQKNLDMMNQWLILKHMGISIDTILKKRNINIIAIYGMGICGRHLVRELEKADIKVCYGLDVKVKQAYKGIPIYKPGKTEDSVDAVINTVCYDEVGIAKILQQYYKCPIINLSELIHMGYPDGIVVNKKERF